VWRMIGQEGRNSVSCPLNNIATRHQIDLSIQLTPR
jgi:hypothetical protein